MAEKFRFPFIGLSQTFNNRQPFPAFRGMSIVHLKAQRVKLYINYINERNTKKNIL